MLIEWWGVRKGLRTLAVCLNLNLKLYPLRQR